MDYTAAASTLLTIQPEDTMACADIPIINDDLAMEGDETFEVIITPPPGVPADTTPSTVIITDNDSKFQLSSAFSIAIDNNFMMIDHCYKTQV